VLFEFLLIKSLWEINRFLLLRFDRFRRFSLNFLLLNRFSFCDLGFRDLSFLRLFFFDRYDLGLLFDFRLAYNLLRSFCNFSRLLAKESAPVICWLLLWLLRSLLE
jgi:hypothetical protein